MNRTKTALPALRNKKSKLIGNLLIVVVFLVAIHFALMPVRRNLSIKYIDSGNKLLTEKRYLEASVEYHKALYLNKQSGADAKIELADKAQLNILELEEFFRQQNSVDNLEELNFANQVPTSISLGLERIKETIEENQPQLAEVQAELLLEMENESKEIWTYLGLARLQSARIVQMTEQNRKQKLISAKEAFAESNRLDSSYELAKEYLKEIEQMM